MFKTQSVDRSVLPQEQLDIGVNDSVSESLNYQQIFNKRADSYHDAMIIYPSGRDQEFNAILEGLSLQPGDSVLDFPAGGGYLSKYVDSKLDLTHLETSECFAELAHSGSQFPLKFCTTNNLDVQSDHADYFLSLAGMHHTQDKLSLFKEMHRVLKAGGKFVIADAAEYSMTAKFLDGWMANHNSMGHKGWYYNQSTINHLESLGFKSVQQVDKRYLWVFDTKLEAADYCKKMFGIDLATIGQIQNALENNLGFQTIESESGTTKIGLNWELRFISGVK